MKLTIYIPTYRRPEFFNRCLASIEPQRQGIEVVASINGPDEHYWLPDWLTIIRQATNTGGRVQWMLGPLVASGEYLWMLGDDDQVQPGGIASVLEALDGNPGLVLNHDGRYDLGLPMGSTYPTYADALRAQLNAGRAAAITSATLCAAVVFRREAFDLRQAVIRCDSMYGQHYAILANLIHHPVHVVPQPSLKPGSWADASIHAAPQEAIDEHMNAYPANMHGLIRWLSTQSGVPLDPEACWVPGDGFDNPQD